MTEEAILGLPYRMDLAPHVLRHSGLSEFQIDAVRRVLDQFYTGLLATVPMTTGRPTRTLPGATDTTFTE